MTLTLFNPISKFQNIMHKNPEFIKFPINPNHCRTALLIVLLLLLWSSPSFAAHLYKEKYYQNKWCREHGGQAEVVLPDQTRCDCLTDNYAIEFDFGEKWAEAIGQSLYYALQTNKKAGIVLIIETNHDYKFWPRLNSTIMHHKLPIRTWIVRP